MSAFELYVESCGGCEWLHVWMLVHGHSTLFLETWTVTGPGVH